MHALRQRLRPKHQILILKCYPRFQKTAADIKPNSSELSYLLYYASTRRSKLQKVGAFLEQKTDRDIAKSRLGNVQVTLQIITALIEKCPRDLPLYVSTVLYILNAILQSHDINLIEDSVPTFTALCVHCDSATIATLTADQELNRQYEVIVGTYASFASQKTPSSSTGRTANTPQTIRFRTAGLQAIRSLVSSESFAEYSGKHLRVVMDPILQNLYSDNAGHLALLRYRENSNEQHEKEQHTRLRQSVSLQRNADSMEADPSIAAGTAADVDQRAEEDVGVLALQSLRQIYTADNRGRVRAATGAIVNFAVSNTVSTHRAQGRTAFIPDEPTWSTEIFEMLCRWTPVQDRFIILVTAMESLIRSPIVEDDLPNQQELTRIIGWLLRSNINFIGLSVMDVLIGLIQHILLLLQLGGQGSGLSPHHQQGHGLSSEKAFRSGGETTNTVLMEVVTTPSPPRIQLLDQLHHCIGDLATHVYYSDQIGDMLTSILLRLKPSPNSSIPTAAAAVQNPVGAAEAIADSVNIHEKPNTDGFFSFDTARVLALQAVTDILVVANSRRQAGANAVGRNRVDVSIWEGTQWLLRDPDGRVRKAYVEALLTWLSLEVDKKQLNLLEDHSGPAQSKRKEGDLRDSPVARRAISNASQRSKARKQAHSSFLQLLHLAVYETAHQYAQSEPDILLLHLLLVNLIQKLGVNSIRTGLPMIFRLQDDIQSLNSLPARTAIGSLVHGYFWTLSETFDFEGTLLGRDIHGEISRRSNSGSWLNSVRMPPVPLERLGSPANSDFRPRAHLVPSHNDPLRPFDDRHALVETIADAYAQTMLSPPTSPQASPARSFSIPTINMNPGHTVERSLPTAVRAQMLRPWTKEACLAAVLESERAKAISIGGGSSSPRHYLSVLNDGAVRYASSAHSSTYNGKPQSARDGPVPTQKQPTAPNRRTSRSSSRTPLSASSTSRSIVHVADLKRVLEGGHVPQLPLVGAGGRSHGTDDTASDSMISASGSEGSGSGSDNEVPNPDAIGTAIDGPSEPHSQAHQLDEFATGARKYSYTPGQDDDIPPVPMLPASLRGSSSGLDQFGGLAEEGRGHQSVGLSGGSVTGTSGSWGRASVPGAKVDVDKLLSGIEETERSRVRARPTTVSGMSAPPY